MQKLTIAMGLGLFLAGSTANRATAPPEASRQVTFSWYAVELYPPPEPAGLDVSRVFSEWQITLASESEGTPTSGYRPLSPPELAPPVDSPVILNGAPNADAGALVITFGSPVWRLGVSLGSEAGTDATVRYFGTDGVQLDEEIVHVGSQYAMLAAHPFEDAEEREISRVEVEYENPNEPETLVWLVADFVKLPTFRRCVAQVAHGAVLGTDQMLQTQLSMTNSAVPLTYSGGPEARVQLEVRNPSGAASPLLLDGQPTNLLPLTFGIYGVRSRVVRTSLVGAGLERGYACVTANYPIEFAAVYRLLGADNQPVSEAGIQAATPGYRFFGVVQKDLAEETNTALAVANVSNETATITLRFLFPLPLPIKKVNWSLEPGEQRAQFLDEILPDLPDDISEGTVEIVSDQAIVATSLRTIDGVVSASLPLGRSPTGNND
ncbi:MAG: hypothetical protein WAO20_16555 [Acidobacteriota bacterium]